MEREIGTAEPRIGNSKELIGNETQFNIVKRLIGSAALVSRWAKTRAEGIGNMSGDIGSFKQGIRTMESRIGTFEPRIGNSKELIGNETQFNTVKGLIGSAALVSRWAKTRAEGIGNMSGHIGSSRP